MYKMNLLTNGHQKVAQIVNPFLLFTVKPLLSWKPLISFIDLSSTQ